MKNVSTIVILFLLLWVLKCGGRLSYYHTCSIALGAQIKRTWRTSQILLYFFWCFGYSSEEKVKDVSTIVILFYCLAYSRYEKMENASALIILFLMLLVFKSRENRGHLNYLILFLLLLVFKSRESEGRLSYSHSFPFASGAQVKRKWKTSQL